MDNKSVMDLFFRKQATRVFLSLNGSGPDVKFIRSIAKHTDSEYGHTLRLLQKFQYCGLARSVKTGRKREYVPTEIGEELAKRINEIIRDKSF